jgi:hypothetical protein
MQLLGDALAVLGSRHGLIFDPMHGACRLLRFDAFAEAPSVQIRAGLRVNGRDHHFPLCPEESRFAFFDQRLSPCSTRFIGIEPQTGLKVTLTFVTPFRPRDADFSTTPVLGVRLQAERLSGNFRWTPVTEPITSAALFFEVGGEGLTVEPNRESVNLDFASRTARSRDWQTDPGARVVAQKDTLVPLSGRREGCRFWQPLEVDSLATTALEIMWCTHSEPVLQVDGRRRPFRYTRRFASLAEVCEWARHSGRELFANARHVDALIADNNLSASINHLLAQTLHSWLINTWWVDRDGADWFSVWEGNCHFHSTVDVEFTQSPFYLTLWPELLGLQLRQWPAFSKDGALTLGERGRGTLFLSHDCGSMAVADGQAYPHEMEVEETTNYLILTYAYWRRTGDFELVRAVAGTLRPYLAFLVAADTAGHGIPTEGVANTIDDASPAIQYGREQVYLAVKTLAAFRCGAAMLAALGEREPATAFHQRAEGIRDYIEAHGWADDHYVTLLCRSSEGLRNPWTGKALDTPEVAGWANCHIYTANAIAVLDLVGLDLGLSPERLRQDLVSATGRCLREYGCAHTDYVAVDYAANGVRDGMVGVASNPGWVSMNMLRDIAAFYRGVDLRPLADRYWNWQTTTNSQTPTLFFETFSGNNLCFYPRGVAVWGFFDALAGRVIDRVADRDETTVHFPGLRVPRLLDQAWTPSEPPRA